MGAVREGACSRRDRKGSAVAWAKASEIVGENGGDMEGDGGGWSCAGGIVPALLTMMAFDGAIAASACSKKLALLSLAASCDVPLTIASCIRERSP